MIINPSDTRPEPIPFTTNYHTHTPRCMHAGGSERSYIEAAIRSGFDTIGFSDHCPWPYSRYISPIRMTMGQTEDYFHTLLSLKKEYEKDIRLYIGFEAEYFPDYLPEFLSFMQDYPLDYLILGHHYIGGEENGIYAGKQGSIHEAELRQYVTEVVQGLRSGYFLYLAHPDLPAFHGSADIYYEEMKKICVAAKEENIPLEINLNGMKRNIHYPCRQFFSIAKEVGNEVVFGVDAHSPNMLTDISLMRESFRFAETLQLPIIPSLNDRIEHCRFLNAGSAK